MQFEAKNYTGAVDDATDSLRRLSLMTSSECGPECDIIRREQVVPLILRARAKKKLERYSDAVEDYQTVLQILPGGGAVDLDWLADKSAGGQLKEELERELRECKRMAKDGDSDDDATGAQRVRSGGSFIHTVMGGFYFKWGWSGWDAAGRGSEQDAGASPRADRKQRGRPGRGNGGIPRFSTGVEDDDFADPTDASDVQKWCELLGIDREATRRASLTEAMVKSAFKKRSLETHPDKNPDDPKATENFQNLNLAKEKLLERL